MRYECMALPNFGSAINSVSVGTWTEDWIRSEALSDLLIKFGFEPSRPSIQILDLVEEISVFTKSHWDFRGGNERLLGDRGVFDDSTNDQILQSAQALGMMDTSEPLLKSYDHLLILGGLIRACILRPRRAAKLIDAGLQVPDIAALGAFRTLSDDEVRMAAQFDFGDVANELDAMDTGVQRAFGLEVPIFEKGELVEQRLNESWWVKTYTGPNNLLVNVVAAPSSEPSHRRANTADTYAFWAKNVARLTAGQTVLLVTTSIYAPFQGLDAIRILSLPYGCEVEIVGLGVGAATDVLRQNFSPVNYLQEINSTVQAIRQLLHQI